MNSRLFGLTHYQKYQLALQQFQQMIKDNQDPQAILSFLATDIDAGEILAVLIMRKNFPDFLLLTTLKSLLQRGASPLQIIALLAQPSAFGWTVLHNAFYAHPNKLVEWLYFLLDIIDACQTNEEKFQCAEKIYEALLSPAAYIYVNHPTRPLDYIKPGVGTFPIHRDYYFELIYELEKRNVHRDKLRILLNAEELEKEHKKQHPVITAIRAILRLILPRKWFEKLEVKYFLPEELQSYNRFVSIAP